jgi:hypothetical protein
MHLLLLGRQRLLLNSQLWMGTFSKSLAELIQEPHSSLRCDDMPLGLLPQQVCGCLQLSGLDQQLLPRGK